MKKRGNYFLSIVTAYLLCFTIPGCSNMLNQTKVVAAPVFSVMEGEVSRGTTVEITCATEGAAIYYTVDGTDPTIESNQYKSPIIIDPPVTLNAIAVKDGLNNSTISSVTYLKSSKEKSLTYSSAYFVLQKNTDITQMEPQIEGFIPEIFSITPELPEGLIFDTTTGVITGNSKTTQTKTKYTIKATNKYEESAETNFYLKVISGDIQVEPFIEEFRTNSERVSLGGTVTLTASFKNGTGIITPGNITVTSGVPVNVYPKGNVTYTLTVTDSYDNCAYQSIPIEIYLEGKYTYELKGTNPISSKFVFYSTGIGNYTWSRKFTGTVDYSNGTFNYSFKDGKIDLYWTKWTNGTRTGTHSYITSYDTSSLTFSGYKYKKTSESPY